MSCTIFILNPENFFSLFLNKKLAFSRIIRSHNCRIHNYICYSHDVNISNKWIRFITPENNIEKIDYQTLEKSYNIDLILNYVSHPMHYHNPNSNVEKELAAVFEKNIPVKKIVFYDGGFFSDYPNTVGNQKLGNNLGDILISLVSDVHTMHAIENTIQKDNNPSNIPSCTTLSDQKEKTSLTVNSNLPDPKKSNMDSSIENITVTSPKEEAQLFSAKEDIVDDNNKTVILEKLISNNKDQQAAQQSQYDTLNYYIQMIKPQIKNKNGKSSACVDLIEELSDGSEEILIGYYSSFGYKTLITAKSIIIKW